MIVFITSVRHPLNSTSYDRVEALLKRTLASVCNQSDQDFRVIVICNKTPDFSNEFSKVDFIEVDFPAPSDVRHSKIPREAIRRDRASKYFVGILQAQQYSPEYIMFFDADDLLSKNIAGYVNSHPNKSGFYVSNGYVYGDGGISLKRKPNFHLACGSSIIYSFGFLRQIFGDALTLEIPLSQEQIMGAIDEYIFDKILGDHSSAVKYAESLERPFTPLPFPAAIWMVNTGENRSVDKGLSTVTGGLVLKQHREEFLLDSPELSLERIIRHILRFPPALLISIKLLVFRDFLNYVRRSVKSFFLIFLKSSTSRQK